MTSLTAGVFHPHDERGHMTATATKKKKIIGETTTGRRTLHMASRHEPWKVIFLLSADPTISIAQDSRERERERERDPDGSQK